MTPTQDGFRLLGALILATGFSGCDKETAANADVTKAAPNAAVDVVAKAPPVAAVISAKLDLSAIVDAVEKGEIEDATALEAALAAEGVATVDVDADGNADTLHVIERREGKVTTFEIRAAPSTALVVEANTGAALEAESAVEIDEVAEAEARAKTRAKTPEAIEHSLDVSTAPLVAALSLEARADLGSVEAHATYAVDFAAKAGVDVEASAVHRSFAGVGVSASGTMTVSSEANVFVAWTFATKRPTYVAPAFVPEVEPRAEDPCWPPGHCKHGLWKATGDSTTGGPPRIDKGPGRTKKSSSKGHVNGKTTPEPRSSGRKSAAHGDPGRGNKGKQGPKAKQGPKGNQKNAAKGKAAKGKAAKGKAAKGKGAKGKP